MSFKRAGRLGQVCVQGAQQVTCCLVGLGEAVCAALGSSWRSLCGQGWLTLSFCTLRADEVEINALGRASPTNVTGCVRFPVEGGL